MERLSQTVFARDDGAWIFSVGERTNAIASCTNTWLARLVSKSKQELGRRHHPDDRPPMRPPHGWDAGGTGDAGLFYERVDRLRKPAISPCAFDV
jgi:hypothetical protein